MSTPNPAIMTFDEFRGLISSLGSFIFRQFGMDPATLGDQTLADMYAEYVRAGGWPEVEPTPVTAVLWNDRHCDPTVHLFSQRETAETWARTQGHDFDRSGECYSETMESDGELHIGYSPESDCLRVFDVVIDKEVGES